MKTSFGADTPLRRLLSLAAARMRISMQLPLAALREIFDESAYLRFLGRAGLTSSPGAYAAFLRETEATRVRRPRCC
jgi:hypothetical protein